MTHDEEMTARRSASAAILAGQYDLQLRLLPELRALCIAALCNQRHSDRAASRLRANNARQLEIALKQEACYSVLRDILACQTWYEIECRGEEQYKPRGVVEVAQWWATTGLSLASLGRRS